MRKMGHQEGKRGKLGELGGGKEQDKVEKNLNKRDLFNNKRCRSNTGRKGKTSLCQRSCRE